MKSSFMRVACLGIASLCSLTSFAGVDATNYSLTTELINRGIDPLLALIILCVIILLRFKFVTQISEAWMSRSFGGMLAITVAAGIALSGFVHYPQDDGIFAILACLVATFALLHTFGKCTHYSVATSALLLIIILTSFSVPDGFGGKQKGPLCVGIGIAIFAIYDAIINLIISLIRKSCLAKIVAWNKKQGIENEVSPITTGDGETYCIVGLDDGKQIAVNVNCLPDERGYYRCAWIWNDPKDGQCSFIVPSDYQILFNLDTGDIQMPGLKNKDAKPSQKEENPAVNQASNVLQTELANNTLCLGLMSLLPFVNFIAAPAALVAGIFAIRDIKLHPEKHGLCRAWIGIMLGGISTIVGYSALVFYLCK